MEANGQFLFCAQGHLHGYNCKFGGRTKIVDVHLGEKWLKKLVKEFYLFFIYLFFNFFFAPVIFTFVQIKKNPFFRAFFLDKQLRHTQGCLLPPNRQYIMPNFPTSKTVLFLFFITLSGSIPGGHLVMLCDLKFPGNVDTAPNWILFYFYFVFLALFLNPVAQFSMLDKIACDKLY